jgi:hypothetical protein
VPVEYETIQAQHRIQKIPYKIFSHTRGDMRLADFILRDMETIPGPWEAFAHTLLPAAADVKSLTLRDHARQILEAVAKDLSTSQTNEAQLEKSMGRAPD